MRVTEMGRNSDKQCSCDTFETGVMTAVNHDAGSVPVRKEQLKLSTTSSANS